MNGPQDAVERRADRLRAGVDRHRRRRQEPLAGCRLHVIEEIVVGRQPIDELHVRVGLDPGGSQPAAILDARTNEPDDHAHHRQKGEKEAHAREDAFERVERLLSVAIGTVQPRFAEKEDGAVGHFGMLGEERDEFRVRRQVVRVRHQGRVQAQHLRDRRRVLVQDFVQPVAGLPRRALVHHGRGRVPWRHRPRRLARRRPGEQRRQHQGRQQGESGDHCFLYTRGTGGG